MKYLFSICIIGLIGISKIGIAQSLTLWKTYPIQAVFMAMDDIGNSYLVLKDNSLLRINENGDSTGSYQSISNGNIGWVDATNPLRVLVYFPAYNSVVTLDKMLVPLSTTKLQQVLPTSTTAIAAASDGAIWIFDRVNARLKKIDALLQERVTSNDLRQELQQVPNPIALIERNRNVYLSDSTLGIYRFDRYGNFINHYTFRYINRFDVQQGNIVYLYQDSLRIWDMERVKETKFPIPTRTTELIQAYWQGDKILALYQDALIIYRLKD
ncbi:MAG TPA: hypothetical protein PLQ78_11215 [Flavipsychrobacter sp.]|nr:hypothetical protein [Flavipsychrobacter sp.]